MKKLINKENILYLFILISPFLDLISSLFNYWGYSLTPSTIIRPLIPLIFILYIIVIDKKVRSKLLFLMAVYISYIVIHISLYKNIITGVSYGSIIHELQYLANYTYLIFTFILYGYVFYKKQNILPKIVLLFTTTYIGLIYLAIITFTSFTSYLDGVGYKGWFNNSGALGSLLLLSLCIIIPNIYINKLKYIKIITILLTLFYLSFLIGSRVGLYGSILVMVVYATGNYIFKKINNKVINYKLFYTTIIVFVLLLITFGSYTISRRNNLKNIEDDKIHIAYDLYNLKIAIDNNLVADDYMDSDQIYALNKLYDYANEHNFSNIDLRKQQLVYHVYLYEKQDDISLKLFGNGYLSSQGSLILEMEVLALLFNFGLIGFILYFMPFLATFLYCIYVMFKNIKRVDIESIMYTFGVLISYAISMLAGHVYFNTSVMPMIIVIHLLLLNKCMSIKE